MSTPGLTSPIAHRLSAATLLDVITTDDDAIRNLPLEDFCADADLKTLLGYAHELDAFWRNSENLYHRVRSMFFLAALHRYYFPARLGREHVGLIPFASYTHLLERRFTEAIDCLLQQQAIAGPSDGICSALAQAYHDLAFQTLADQVRRSVRTVRGNQWMFRMGHPADHPLRIEPALLCRESDRAGYPILAEQTAVRMDFSHSGWSDIFFLGMDYPTGARVINASIDLGVHGRDPHPKPPIETYLRVIDEPVLRLVSIDLQCHVDLTTIAEVFDFARDYLGLLKGAVIAAGIVPPGLEGCQQPMSELLTRLVGPGRGLELVSHVNDIPKGSRLAVSTNLLGSLISVLMRATGQVAALEGPLSEPERRLIAARAILGEWIGGSGGGWQDSGGIWPGIKLIQGVAAAPGDPEYRVSRGRLLPEHRVFDDQEIGPTTRQMLQDSLVLVHGGMAQNVGPILEMVTEKYLLRSPREWQARQTAIEILREIQHCLERGDLRALGAATTRNFYGPLQAIIPWCNNRYTDALVEQARATFGEAFWGFWMLGGMAGGGMGFLFDPSVKPQAQPWLLQTMQATKRELQHALPFAMEPVVYDFAINDTGSCAQRLVGPHNRMPQAYYAQMVPGWLRTNSRDMPPLQRLELERLGDELRSSDFSERFRGLFENILPKSAQPTHVQASLDELLQRHGFDREFHEQLRNDLRAGRIGLSQNRLPANTTIEDVALDDLYDMRGTIEPRWTALGIEALRAGQVAVMTLAAGVGSRWTEGAGVVKGLHPFCRFAGRHRSFLEVHLAKSRRAGVQYGTPCPHLITTGYLTHAPIVDFLTHHQNFGYPGAVIVSAGKSVGLRTIPMTRDLQFAWEEMPQQVLDEQKQKVRTSLRAALMAWARQAGEGNDYTDNLPLQCMHPVGHWFEFANLLRNGTLESLLDQQPQLKYLLLHNVDTLGASIDPGLLGLHIESGNALSFEVIDRRLEDRGGGLARVNGRVRLLEGLAMPREQDEFQLSFYNSMTTWIDIDQLLAVFDLTRWHLPKQDVVDDAVRQLSLRMPTYVTLKDVKKRWGHGQEDVYPVSQFEKLWSDMTALPELACGFMVVPLRRGQQLKHQAQLDGWLRDGSADAVSRLCDFGP